MTERRVTIRDFARMKEEGEKIAVLTAYDFLSARILDRAGLDVILVGDSLGMVIQGHATTLPVTLDQMIYHAQAVTRAVQRAFVVVDMPYLSYQTSVRDAIANCGRVLKETAAQGVKIEGGEEYAETTRALVRASIPVMGHLGLTPQSIHSVGGYRLQGASAKEQAQLLADAKALEEAGCFSLVLEMVPAEVAGEVTRALRIPTIGIGAGPHCDGQVLVLHDMLGMNPEFRARFVKQFGRVGEEMRLAVERYRAEVKAGLYPSEEHSYHLPAEPP